MKIVTLAVIAGLPAMALAQTEQQQQQTQGQTTQGQTNETQTTAPAKAKKTHTAQEPTKGQTKSQTATETRGKTTGRTQDANSNQAGGRSSTGATSTTQSGHTSTNRSTTKVNVQEFKSRHSEVFTLGRHPRDYFVQRFGTKHVRLIGNAYFAFVDGCWVAVDVDGFTYTERVICQGDPDFVVVD